MLLLAADIAVKLCGILEATSLGRNRGLPGTGVAAVAAVRLP